MIELSHRYGTDCPHCTAEAMERALEALGRVAPLFGIEDLERGNFSGVLLAQHVRLKIGHLDDELELYFSRGLIHLRFHAGWAETYTPHFHHALNQHTVSVTDGFCGIDVEAATGPGDEAVLVSLLAQVPPERFGAATILDAARAWAVWRGDGKSGSLASLPELRLEADEFEAKAGGDNGAFDRLFGGGPSPFPTPPLYHDGLKAWAAALAPHQGHLLARWSWRAERGWPRLTLEIALDQSEVVVALTPAGLELRRHGPAGPQVVACPSSAQLPSTLWTLLFAEWVAFGSFPAAAERDKTK